MLGLYIHIPFCKEKCHYCDFFSFKGKDELMEPYVKALISEIKSFENKGLDIDTVYIGGGTPSILMLDSIKDIMNALKSVFNINKEAEITIEVNPGTVTLADLKGYQGLGINRLSMGAQSFKDKQLKKLGRIHTSKAIGETVAFGRKAGFKNISLDLIYGLPDETIADVRTNVAEGIALGVDHLSLYGLIIEEETPFYKMLAEGNLNLPDEETLLQMRDEGTDLLAENGFKRYEISNYGKTGFQSKHNLIYWHNEPYIGIGANASSYWQNKRYRHVDSIKAYIEDSKQGIFREIDSYEVGNEEAIEEGILLGLRLIDGIDINEFKKRYTIDLRQTFGEAIAALKEGECLKETEDRIFLTPKGLAISNYCLGMFLS